MRVLLIKTSSMGDIIHTFPALTDAANALPNVQFDWVVEDIFAELPPWHRNVSRVIPVRLRHWRRNFLSGVTYKELKILRRTLAEHPYDLILDAQGLVKSAVVAFFAKGIRAGLDYQSAREKFASFVYQQKYSVYFYQHAVNRMRNLFSQALAYSQPNRPPDFGLEKTYLTEAKNPDPYVVFLHGTTWTAKQYPENYWIELAKIAAKEGFKIKLSGGTEDEIKRANRIAADNAAVEVLPRLSITAMADLLARAKAVIAVDTGFGHLAAALSVPTFSLYGPTTPLYTGAIGKYSTHLCADFPCSPCLNRTCVYKSFASEKPACFTTLTPGQVWSRVKNWPISSENQNLN